KSNDNNTSSTAPNNKQSDNTATKESLNEKLQKLVNLDNLRISKESKDRLQALMIKQKDFFDKFIKGGHTLPIDLIENINNISNEELLDKIKSQAERNEVKLTLLVKEKTSCPEDKLEKEDEEATDKNK